MQDSGAFNINVSPENKVIYSPDGKKVALALGEYDFTVRDVEPRSKIIPIWSYVNRAYCVFSPDSRLLAVMDGKIIILKDVETGAELKRLTGHTDPVLSCAFSPDSRMIVSGSMDLSLRVWDVETGQVLRTLTGHIGYGDIFITCVIHGDNGWVQACAFSPDGKRVVSASNDRSVRLWDVETGRELKKLIGHADQVRSCAYSPDGKLIASAAFNSTVRIWDEETGKVLKELAGHMKPVFTCVFTPDGERVVTLSWDNTVRVWDAITGDTISTFTFTPLTNDPLECLGIAGNKEIVIGDERGIHYVFPLPENDSGIPQVTAARLYSLTDHAWDLIVSVFCPWCGTRLKIDQATVSLLREINYTHRSGRSRKVPESAEKDPRLIMGCPGCSGKFRLTTYLVDNSGPK